jgi:predicted Rdx family selenoprotein
MTYRPAPSDEVLYHEEAGEAFLLHVPTGEYFGLNPAGVIVWKALRDGADPEAELARRWPDVPRDDLRRDAARLLETLRDAGLVVDSDEPAGGEA